MGGGRRLTEWTARGPGSGPTWLDMRRRAAIVWAGRLDVGPQLAQYEALLSAGRRAHAVLYRTTADRSR